MSATDQGKKLASSLNTQLDEMKLTGQKRSEQMVVLMTGALIGARIFAAKEFAEHIEMRLECFQDAIGPKKTRNRKLKVVSSAKAA